MNELFPPEPEELAVIAKRRLPRVAKASGRCAADFDTEAQRAEFQKRMHNRSVAEMERQRIQEARAKVKAETPRKPRKKREKGV